MVGVTQGHRQCHHSVERIRLPILFCTVFPRDAMLARLCRRRVVVCVRVMSSFENSHWGVWENYSAWSPRVHRELEAKRTKWKLTTRTGIWLTLLWRPTSIIFDLRWRQHWKQKRRNEWCSDRSAFWLIFVTCCGQSCTPWIKNVVRRSRMNNGWANGCLPLQFSTESSSSSPLYSSL